MHKGYEKYLIFVIVVCRIASHEDSKRVVFHDIGSTVQQRSSSINNKTSF